MVEPDSAPAPAPQPEPTRDDLEAVWEQQPNEDYRRDMSHWRGEGRWDDAAWSAIGATTRQRLTDAAMSLRRGLPRGPLLEWGPGGGSNLHAFANFSRRLYGVDVSQRNLDESARVLGELSPAPDFTPIVVGEDPTEVATAITDPPELFVSTAVFQHFPTREYGAVVLRTVAGLLSPRAIGLIQIRYDDGSPKYAQKTDDYRRRHVTFTSYPIDDFWDLLVECGLQPLAITDVRSDVNYATFTFVPAPATAIDEPQP